jgi:glycosyltransferase involved in cell wall biosynthesis
MSRLLIYSSGFNCADAVRDCLRSVRGQTRHPDLHVVVDDASTDDTWEKITQFKDARVRAYRSPQNRKWTRNALEYLKPQAQDIVVILDLDDGLAHPRVLERLDREYRKGCWLTYGNYYRKSRDAARGRLARWCGLWRLNPDWLGCCSQLPPEVVRQRTFRQYPFTTAHLRSFKGFLWNAIRPEDLLDWNGRHPVSAGDVVTMLPMLEMCAPGKIVFIPDVLYAYDDRRALNDHALDRPLQEKTEMWFRQKPRYPILSPPPGPEF